MFRDFSKVMMMMVDAFGILQRNRQDWYLFRSCTQEKLIFSWVQLRGFYPRKDNIFWFAVRRARCLTRTVNVRCSLFGWIWAPQGCSAHTWTRRTGNHKQKIVFVCQFPPSVSDPDLPHPPYRLYPHLRPSSCKLCRNYLTLTRVLSAAGLKSNYKVLSRRLWGHGWGSECERAEGGGRGRVWQTAVAPEITGIRERERPDLVFAVGRDKTAKVGGKRLMSACKHVVKRDMLLIHSDATDYEVTLLAAHLSTPEIWILGWGEILWLPILRRGARLIFWRRRAQMVLSSQKLSAEQLEEQKEQLDQQLSGEASSAGWWNPPPFFSSVPLWCKALPRSGRPVSVNSSPLCAVDCFQRPFSPWTFM